MLLIWWWLLCAMVGLYAICVDGDKRKMLVHPIDVIICVVGGPIVAGIGVIMLIQHWQSGDGRR